MFFSLFGQLINYGLEANAEEEDGFSWVRWRIFLDACQIIVYYQFSCLYLARLMRSGEGEGPGEALFWCIEQMRKFCALTFRVGKKNTASLTQVTWAPTLQQLTRRNSMDWFISKSKNVWVVCIQVVHTQKNLNKFYNISTVTFLFFLKPQHILAWQSC